MTSVRIQPRTVAATLTAFAALAGVGGCPEIAAIVDVDTNWSPHTIDDRLRGADGVRLGDLNSDGLTDLVVAWEESARVVAYLNPGPTAAGGNWPRVIIAELDAVEDAFIADLDADGAPDIITCTEGGSRSIHVHWAPIDADRLLDANAWTSAPIPTTTDRQRWMFATAAQLDSVNGLDLVAGGKGDDAHIGWLRAPANPRNLADWTWTPLRQADWTMSVITRDINNDGYPDIVLSDRKGDRRGCYWLEHPGPLGLLAGAWTTHTIDADIPAMFLDVADINADGRLDIAAALDDRELRVYLQTNNPLLPWQTVPIALSASFGTAKGVRLADLTGDDQPDLAFSCENATGRTGVGYLEILRRLAGDLTSPQTIAPNAGSKFDLVQACDIDNDGDLDIITTEESANLGVVWYENPTGD